MYLSGVLGLAPAIKGNEVGSWLSPGHTDNWSCRVENKNSKPFQNNFLVNVPTQTRHDCGSTEYLPDIKSGVTLGHISGWKPPNAWMARKCLNSGARLAVMAQRAGCTAFNPWHDGLPCSVWKHQLWFSNPDLLWRSIQPGWRSTRRTDTHWWEFYMVVWCSAR